MIFLFFLISLAHAPTGNFAIIDAICDDMKIEREQLEVACDIEEVARQEGIKESWFIKSLIVNAYAESSLDPNAVSPGRTSYGVFQLHIDGMGQGWSIKDMKDIKKSTKAIVKEAKSMGIYNRKRSSKTATEFLCKKVLRPKNSEKQIEKRIDLLEDLF